MSAPGHRRAAATTRARFAVITTSDTRTPRTDESGRVARKALEKCGHEFAGAALVSNAEKKISAAIRKFLKVADLVVVAGGTGAGPRDVSIPAAEKLFDRHLPGFGELFRALSWKEVGSAAMLSRATLGLVKGRAVCVTPGSPSAVKLALSRLIGPELAHLLHQARR